MLLNKMPLISRKPSGKIGFKIIDILWEFVISFIPADYGLWILHIEYDMFQGLTSLENSYVFAKDVFMYHF